MVHKFFKKWKSDKNFRNIIIVISFIVLMFGNNIGTEAQATINPEDEAYCNSLHGFTTTDFNNCVGTPGCHATIKQSGNWPFGIDDVGACVAQLLSLNLADNCVSKAQNGVNILDDGNAGCLSGFSIKQGTLCGHTVYTCQEPPGGLGCKSWQTPIAEFMDSLWKDNDFSCSTKSYLVIGGIGMIVLAIL